MRETAFVRAKLFLMTKTSTTTSSRSISPRHSARRPPPPSDPPSGGVSGSSRPSMPSRRPLVAPPVFARILPANVGGHVDDDSPASSKRVAKRLHSWSGSESSASVPPRVTLEDDHGPAEYRFFRDVFGPGASQSRVFDAAAAPLLRRCLEDLDDPRSAFVFAYGQTGTGKTHTIMGPEASWREVGHPERGLFPRVVDDVLRVQRAVADTHVVSLGVSAVEFYFCQGFDLLDDHAQVDVRDGEIVGRKQAEVKTLEDALDVLATVRARRTTASTKMNPAVRASGGGGEKDTASHGGSSRSHCALTAHVTVVNRATKVVRVATFGAMDLAGAERPSSNGHEFAGVMEAVMSYWRDPASVRPCAQAAIINLELAALRSAIVQATEAHAKGREVAAPTQLGTAAVNYMTGLFDGRCQVANVVTLSQARKCGWETWFACTYAEDVAKLRMPPDYTAGKKTADGGVNPLGRGGKRKKKKKETLAEWRVRAIATRDEAREALAKTPAKGHPSSKFHQRRVIDARHWTQEAEIAERLEERLEGE